MAILKNTTIEDNSALQLPVGTTTQRPSADNGMLRFNSSLGCVEYWSGSAWISKPDIVKDNLSLYLNAGIPNSYSGSGNIWYDISGNNRNATLFNGVSYDSLNGGSLVFNGSPQYAEVGSIAGNYTSFTVCLWINSSSVSNYRNAFDANYGNYALTGNVGPRFEQDNSGYTVWVVSGSTNTNSVYDTYVVTTNSFPANTWRFVAITRTYSGLVSTFYNNNIPRIMNTNPNGFVNSFGNVNIGRGFHLSGAERYFIGKISSVMIYNRALSYFEIQQNYNATKARFGL